MGCNEFLIRPNHAGVTWRFGYEGDYFWANLQYATQAAHSRAAVPEDGWQGWLFVDYPKMLPPRATEDKG
jgi:hypothetical protein